MPWADGRSLLGVLADRRPAWRHDFLLEHLTGPPQAYVPTYCGVRTGRFKYVLYQTGEEELYDLQLDPYELRNLAGDPAFEQLKANLRARTDVLCNPRPPGFTALVPRLPG
jgi:arylsulfatase A-like enzyme